MRELIASEIHAVFGGKAASEGKREHAQACANDIFGAGGMGATLGAIIGGIFGSAVPVFGTAAGATLGGLVGAALGGGATAESSPNCRP